MLNGAIKARILRSVCLMQHLQLFYSMLTDITGLKDSCQLVTISFKPVLPLSGEESFGGLMSTLFEDPTIHLGNSLFLSSGSATSFSAFLTGVFVAG